MKKNLLLSLLLGTICIGCSSGSSDANQNDSKPPLGPISYGYVNAIFADPHASKTTQKQLNASAFSCQNPLQIANWGLSFVKLFTSLIPGPVGTGINAGLGFASNTLSIAGTLEGNSCQSAQLNVINQELQQQQQEINQIESNLDLFENNFYVQNVVTQSEITTTNQYLYKQNFLSLAGNTNSGIDGSFQRFMIDSTLWNQYAQSQPSITAESIVANSTAMSQLNDFIASNTTFSNLVTNLSGSQYNQNTCSINCYNTVSQYNSSSLILVYQSLYQELLSEVNAAINNHANAIPLFDQYNQSISSIYLQSLYALQEAFFMEQLINQLNVLSQNSTQLGSLGNVPGTYFSYNNYSTGESQGYYVQQYNNAQNQLALIYSARANQLYINTLSYIVSDQPKGNQQLPPLNLNYTYNGTQYTEDLTSVYNNISKSVMTPMQIFFSNNNTLNSSIEKTAFAYQYSGLTNIQACEAALNAYNLAESGQGVLSQGLNSSNCPAIFASSPESAYNQAIYNGNSFQPYFAIPSESPILSGMIQNAMAIPQINNLAVANSTAACENNTNLYWYIPNGAVASYAEIGTPYLACNLWQSKTDLIITSNFAPNWTMDIQSANAGTKSSRLNWGYNNLVIFPYNITPVSADSWTYFTVPDTYQQGGYTLMNMGGSAYNVTSNQLAVGNMPSNYTLGSPYSVHQMAFQVTAADGFVSSFVLQFFNHSGWEGNYIGVTCNQMLNNVAFVTSDGSLQPIQTSCNQTTNNPSSVTVNYVNISPPTVSMGTPSMFSTYSIYNFGD